MAAKHDELIPTRWTLIRRLKNLEDQESWHEFFQIYWRLIYRAATRAGLTNDEAQEVVQETVISISRKISKFKASPDAGSFKGWLLQLARWRILDQIRKRPPEHSKGHPKRIPSETSTTARIPDPAGHELEKVWEEEWESSLMQAALERAQRQVSTKQYQIFFLHVIQEQDVRKVARALGVTPNQVYLAKNRILPLYEKARRDLETNPA